MVDLEEIPCPMLMDQPVSSNQLCGLFGKKINNFIPFHVYMGADKKTQTMILKIKHPPENP